MVGDSLITDWLELTISALGSFYSVESTQSEIPPVVQSLVAPVIIDDRSNLVTQPVSGYRLTSQSSRNRSVQHQATTAWSEHQSSVHHPTNGQVNTDRTSQSSRDRPVQHQATFAWIEHQSSVLHPTNGQVNTDRTSQSSRDRPVQHQATIAWSEHQSSVHHPTNGKVNTDTTSQISSDNRVKSDKSEFGSRHGQT